jgi:hypothetical protein
MQVVEEGVSIKRVLLELVVQEAVVLVMDKIQLVGWEL